MRILAKDIPKHEGQEIELCGWVDVSRSHGKVLFVDLRDRSGITQLIFLQKPKELYEVGLGLRPEWVVRIKGTVNKRPEGMQNPNIPTGMHEVQVSEVQVYSKAETPPFEISGDGYEVGEELRMQYRYLDLRRERLQNNVRMRDKTISFFREYMHKNDFVEIETPILMKGTPEGAREYIVPSRIQQGKFYALPQSPQQFKQLTMVAGFERYFQIARCFRDEDTRGDRQPEFTQLDYEMSFVTQEEILLFTEAMFISLIQSLYPEKTITKIPFPRFTHKEAMEKYQTDKPDLRSDKNNKNELAFCWILDFPMFEKGKDGNIQAVHHPFCSIKEEDKLKFMKSEDVLSIHANAYDLVLNGFELSSGSIRIHEPEMQKQVFKLLNVSNEEQEKKFGHMLKAFTYGVPPHGGFAPGIDRIVMILQNEPNIREVVAFPKTGDGRDLMMQAPSEIDNKQLEELGLEIKKNN